MRAFVGVTDRNWYRFLSVRPHLTEVNFWRPSGRGFRAIGSGEPFLFKTHMPDDALVGGGFLSGSVELRLSEAWEYFGEGNGVASLAEMRRSISAYRREPLGVGDDPMIGCVLLRNVFFVGERQQYPTPPDWASNIVVGKTYDLASPSGSYLEAALKALLDRAGPGTEVPGDIFGDPRLVAPRLGQQAFKALVLTAYHRRCAVTGAKIRPTLEAAHIRPISFEGQHRTDNGLLLRSDVHTLFDRGYLGIEPVTRTLQVSPRIRADFGNGDELYDRAGHPLIVTPQRKMDQPNREALEWHMDTVFRSA